MPEPLTAFQSELLTDLRSQVGARRPPRRAPFIAGSGALAAAACIAVAASGVLAPSPAYAVTELADGDIQITLTSLADEAGLIDELAKHGVSATIDFEPGFTVVSDEEADEYHLVPTEEADEPTPGEIAEAEEYVQAYERACGLGTGDEGPTIEVTETGATITIPKALVEGREDLTITTAGGGDDFAALQLDWGTVVDGNSTYHCGISTFQSTTP